MQIFLNFKINSTLFGILIEFLKIVLDQKLVLKNQKLKNRFCRINQFSTNNFELINFPVIFPFLVELERWLKAANQKPEANNFKEKIRNL